MPRRARTATLAVLCSIASLGASAAPSRASSSLDFIPCAAEHAFSCTDLAVPLDRSGTVAGTISLSIERKLAGTTPTADAVLALAGGPGQAALPFAGFAAKAMAAGLHTRDMLVFDQRGTGSSDPLGCQALERFNSITLALAFQRCAEEIGPARGAFTTQESVQDIEALRQAAGYEKLVLYGTSYGTKVALEYAERYPQHVEALLLDSVVPITGPEPFAIPTFEALAPVLHALCSDGVCRGITTNPLADMTRLIAKLRVRPLAGSVYDGLGHRHDTTLDEVGLLDILRTGDLNPALRALLPAAVKSALHDDPDPLLRLQALSEGLIPNVPSAQTAAADEEGGEALFVATTCEESLFPWQRTAPTATRLAEAKSFLQAQPATDFAPFDARTALRQSLVTACDGWPDASPAPPASQPLPDVPTLILSGAQDLRTPTSGAEQVAALIPDAQVEVVPFTGHSVVGSDLTGCATKALSAFFSGQPVTPCTSTHDALAPTPITPTRLAGVHAPAGLGGRPGQTVVAVIDTLVDLNRQVIAATLQAQTQLPSGASFGGLHGGYARLNPSKVVLKNLCFVPGVRLSGSFPLRHGQLVSSEISISGPEASPGTVRFGSAASRVSGTLGGHSFNLSLAKVRAARAGSDGWPAVAPTLSRLGRAEASGALQVAGIAQLP
jgi:pimeloyl-ACP methyl ester carboxylesterase